VGDGGDDTVAVGTAGVPDPGGDTPVGDAAGEGAGVTGVSIGTDVGPPSCVAGGDPETGG